MRSYGTKIENTLNPNLKDTDGLKYRLGEPGDILPIAATLLKEKMNPLSLDHERFIVCETASGERVGFGQVSPWSCDGNNRVAPFDGSEISNDET